MISPLFFLSGVLAATSAFPPSATPDEIVSDLQTLTQKVQALQGPARDITAFNGPQLLIGRGPFPVSP